MSQSSTASRAGGAMSPARPAARAPSTIGPCTRRPTLRSRPIAAPGPANIWSLRRRCTSIMINVETIGGRMIEVHLRLSDQWPDLYGAGWVEALVRLYGERRWDFADHDRRDGYSVVLFGPHGPRYRHPPGALATQVRQMPGVSSVQITFHEDKEPERHAMPPGGFRLAIVNAFDLQAGRAGREMLRTHFLA